MNGLKKREKGCERRQRDEESKYCMSENTRKRRRRRLASGLLWGRTEHNRSDLLKHRDCECFLWPCWCDVPGVQSSCFRELAVSVSSWGMIIILMPGAPAKSWAMFRWSELLVQFSLWTSANVRTFVERKKLLLPQDSWIAFLGLACYLITTSFALSMIRL